VTENDLKATNDPGLAHEDDDWSWINRDSEIHKPEFPPSERYITEHAPIGKKRVEKRFHAVGMTGMKPTILFHRPEDVPDTEDEPQKYDYGQQAELSDILGTDEPEIRVIELLPGEFRDGLECTLQVVNLNTPSEYEALSYTWRESPVDWPIRDTWPSSQGKELYEVCNVRLPIYMAGTNCFISIGAGLRDALQCLRHPTEIRRIWADQICINQESIDERNKQVGFMHEIYSKARKVILWTGEEDQYS
jgi:hypothetical protein